MNESDNIAVVNALLEEYRSLRELLQPHRQGYESPTEVLDRLLGRLEELEAVGEQSQECRDCGRVLGEYVYCDGCCEHETIEDLHEALRSAGFVSGPLSVQPTAHIRFLESLVK